MIDVTTVHKKPQNLDSTTKGDCSQIQPVPEPKKGNGMAPNDPKVAEAFSKRNSKASTKGIGNPAK